MHTEAWILVFKRPYKVIDVRQKKRGVSRKTRRGVLKEAWLMS